MIEYMATNTDGYQPGVCNIGPAEIRRRRQIGWLGVAGTIGLAALLVAVDAPAVANLLLAVPAGAAFSGFIQARLRFCAGYGAAGLQNLGELGEATGVQDAEARAADRNRALRIHGASIAAGVAVTVVFTLLAI